MKFFGKKLIALSTLLIVIIISLVIVFLYLPQTYYPDANYDSELIQKVYINSNMPLATQYYTNKFDVTTKVGIDTIIYCVQRLKSSNQSTDFMTFPIEFEFIYIFKNGKQKSIKRTIKSSSDIQPIFELDEVIKQRSTIYHIKISDISMASVNYSPQKGNFIQKQIIDLQNINFLFELAKVNVLQNKKNTYKSNCGITFLDKNNNILCGFELNSNTYKLTELREKIPEINEIVTIAEKNQYR